MKAVFGKAICGVMMIKENQFDISLQTVKQIWKDLHANPDLRQRLRPEILQSWERCYVYGVPRYMKKIPYVLTDSELQQAREKSRYMIEIAVPIMEHLSEFVKGTGFTVGLTDANCVSLKIMGDRSALELAERANVVEGTIWSEDKVGTNAIALSVSLRKPISIYAYEHFSLYTIAASSSAAPIIDNGRVIGSICMSASFEKVTHHTLGMVVAAAAHIESIMALNRLWKYQQAMTDSMSDGVLMVDVNGNITYINNKCLSILGLNSENVIGTSIHTLFGDNPRNKRFLDIITQGRAVTDEYLLLHCGKKNISCQLTCTPLHELGCMLIIRESEQLNRIVGKWIGHNAKMSFDDIVGKDIRFREVIDIAKAISHSDSSVLLMGESGTGKDMIAQAIHNESPRRNQSFVAINCAALPRELIASELFGYDEGAFTGAKKGGNVGKFELANHGTLFLDEIGDVPMDSQVSLLRVLEEKAVIRLGGHQLIPINVRIIAATNKNLEEEVARGRFRQDLYYRLGVIRLMIPPLRERRNDIPLLVDYFLRTICKRFGKPLMRMTPAAIDYLMNYDWPGNIRELQNVLEGAVQLTPGTIIESDFFERHLNPITPQLLTDNRINHSIEYVDKIRNLLLENKYNISKTAKELGISRQRLYRLMQKYNIR